MEHIAWLALVVANFIVQMLYFRRPGRGLFIAKRITTPLMLFGALAVIRIASGSVPLIQGLLLAAMGLGELGIEGSKVVETRDGAGVDDSPEDDVQAGTPWTVTAAGALFLAVNVALGLVLILAIQNPGAILTGTAGSLIVIGSMVWLLLKTYRPDGETRFQIILYSMGLAVLAAGAAAWLASLSGGGNPGGNSYLGRAALILTISDSLVLWRMGAAWDKTNPGGHRKLMIFLVVILLLYYLYTGILISSAAPFSAA